eukprot:PhM_4_TR6032/c0_g1_i1/m.41326
MHKTLFVLFGIAVSIVLASEAIHHHSLEPPYVIDGWEMGIPFWEIGGDAIVTNNYVRLTPDQSSRVGYIYNTQVGDLPSWQLVASLRVHSKRSPGADGIALWYVENPRAVAQHGPLWGMPTNFKGLGIVLDTYDNDMQRDNPAIMAIVGTGESTQRWDLDRDLTNEAKLKCVLEYRNTAKNNNVHVRAVYHHRRLEVFVKIGSGSTETLCGVAEDIELPQGYHFAASASTGHLVDTHDLYSFLVSPAPGTTTDHDPQIPVMSDFNPEKERQEKEYWAPKQQQ